MSIVRLFGTWMFCFVCAVQAQTLSTEEIDNLERVTDIICTELRLDGGSSFLSLSAEAEAEARLLLKKLGSGSADIDVDSMISRFSNVPRDELSDLLQSAQTCRLRVFEALVGGHRDSSYINPAPSQPHAESACFMVSTSSESPFEVHQDMCITNAVGEGIVFVTRADRRVVQYTTSRGDLVACYPGDTCSFGWQEGPLFSIAHRGNQPLVVLMR